MKALAVNKIINMYYEDVENMTFKLSKEQIVKVLGEIGGEAAIKGIIDLSEIDAEDNPGYQIGMKDCADIEIIKALVEAAKNS